MPPDNPPSIYDVAAHAGCSKSTVSRVLQGSPFVAERTRQRVLQCVEELGYSHSPTVRMAMQEARAGRKKPAVRDLMLVLVPSAYERLASGTAGLAEKTAAMLGYQLRTQACETKNFPALERRFYAEGGVGIIGYHYPFFAVENFGVHHRFLVPTINLATAPNPTHQMPQIAPHPAGSARLAAFHARASGYRRVGLQYNIWDDPFHEFRGALAERLEHYGIRFEVCGRTMKADELRLWIQDHHIDCLITSEADLLVDLENKLPHLGLICGRAEELPAGLHCSGLFTDIADRIEYAVRLLIRRLEIPPHGRSEPNLHLFEPTWKEGGTLGTGNENSSIRSIPFPEVSQDFPSSDTRFQPIDLHAFANAPFTGASGLFPNLAEEACPRGLHQVCGVPFEFLEERDKENNSLIFTRNTRIIPISIDSTARALYFLHCCTYAVGGSVIGYYHIHFRRKTVKIPLRPAADRRHQTHAQTQAELNICDWWKSCPLCENDQAKPAWIIQDASPLVFEGHLCVFRWTSPYPTEPLTRVTIEIREDTRSELALLGLTMELPD